MTPRDNYNKHKKKTDTESYPKVIPPTSRWAPPRVTRPPTLHSTTMTPPTEKQAKMMNELTAPHRWAAGARARWGGVEYGCYAARPPWRRAAKPTARESEGGSAEGAAASSNRRRRSRIWQIVSVVLGRRPSLSTSLIPSPLLFYIDRQRPTAAQESSLRCTTSQPKLNRNKR